MDYDEFVESKRLFADPSGFDVSVEQINPALFDYQRDITRWALRVGKAAVFGDCGLGKGWIELEWAHQVSKETGGRVLILAPLAVSYQFQQEADKLGVSVHLSKRGDDIQDGINVTNYQKLHLYEPSVFAGIAADESSILKAEMGKIRHQLTSFAREIPYRLSASATPAPNDLPELIHHAEYLGIMKRSEIIALFFTQDGNNSSKFRLKRHAINEFWKWMASWSVAFRKPSDLGYSDEGFILPKLHTYSHKVDIDPIDNGTLFVMEAQGLDEQRRVRRASMASRVAKVAELVNSSDEPWLIWCELIDEGDNLRKAIPDSIEVRGGHSDEYKEDAAIGFVTGKHRVLISKSSIFGFGMNFQHCHNVIFVGMSNSYEQYYQAIRRVWRFGQKSDVNVHIITTDADGRVIENIARKEKQAMDMYDQIVKHMAPETNFERVARQDMEYNAETEMTLPSWLISYTKAEEEETKRVK